MIFVILIQKLSLKTLIFYVFAIVIFPNKKLMFLRSVKFSTSNGQKKPERGFFEFKVFFVSSSKQPETL